jgi:hypothetical protein
MKKILLICLIALFGCNDSYNIMDTAIVKGIVSAKEEGHKGRLSNLPKLYIQDNKHTITIDIPFANENDYKVGDSITVIVQQVEKIKK